MSRTIAIVCALLAACLSSTSAAAQDLTGRVSDVSFEVDAPWPERLGKGYFPLFVRLENESGEPRRVVLETSRSAHWLPSQELRRVVELGPGKRVELELLAPVFHPQGYENGQATYLSLSTVDEERGYGLTPGGQAWYDGTFSAMVFRAPNARGLDGGDVEQLLESVAAGGRPPVTLSGSATYQFSAQVSNFAFLAQHWDAYSSLDAVVLDLSSAVPREEQLAPLFAWVRLGGRLVVVGEGAQARLAEFDSLQDVFEARFTDGQAYRVGLGRVVFSDEPLSAASPSVRQLLDELQRATPDGSRDTWVPVPETWRLQGQRLAVPGVDELPLRAFLLLLFAFAVIIGPVNLIVIKRLRRPALLLFTIPGVSLLASLGILGYGIFHQGVDIKLATRTLTVLDQRRDVASTIDQRTVFVGFSSGRGLLPGPGTAVFPSELQMFDDQRFTIESGEGQRVLQSSFLPVRAEATQVVMTSAPAQGRLELRADGARIEVTNQFIGADVVALLLRDTDGAWYRLGDLPEGASATVERLADWSEARGIPSEITWSAGMYADLVLAPGTYVAHVSANPFRDALGLTTTDKLTWHVVYGILEEDWR